MVCIIWGYTYDNRYPNLYNSIVQEFSLKSTIIFLVGEKSVQIWAIPNVTELSHFREDTLCDPPILWIKG